MFGKIECCLQKRSTESIRCLDQFSYWYDVVCEKTLKVELNRRQRGAFHGIIQTYQFGPLAINQVKSDEHIAHLTHYGISRLSTHYYKFHIQKSAIAKVSQNGRENILNPGDAVLIDSLSPFQLDFPTDFECYSVKIPRERLRPLLKDPRAATNHAVISGSPLSQAITNYIHFLINIAGKPLAEDQLDLYTNNLLGLIAVATSASACGREAAHQAWQEKRISQIKQYIVANLNDPELTPTKVADHFSISASYLHKLFAREEQTFCNFLREQRLTRAALHLQKQSGKRHTITELAYDLGFNDLSYFWRLFRERYGMTPGAFRNLVSS